MAPVSTGCGAFLRGNDVILPDSGDFSLPETLDCGQAFRWKRLPDGGFFGVARGRA
ncbi:MAG: DNA glycosylase, partial [Anaerotruncus massiliensis (ex Togo et al. 2019)]